jgi:hypothetical protein
MSLETIPRSKTADKPPFRMIFSRYTTPTTPTMHLLMNVSDWKVVLLVRIDFIVPCLQLPIVGGSSCCCCIPCTRAVHRTHLSGPNVTFDVSKEGEIRSWYKTSTFRLDIRFGRDTIERGDVHPFILRTTAAFLFVNLVDLCPGPFPPPYFLNSRVYTTMYVSVLGLIAIDFAPSVAVVIIVQHPR